MQTLSRTLLTAAALLSLCGAALPQTSSPSPMPHAHHGHHSAGMHEQRTLVQFPPELMLHTLSSMRAHLAALNAIVDALGRADFQKAADLAETHLGMSSLHDHRAVENAQHMPPAMAQIGTAMHRAASQFAIAAQNASATGDFKKPLAALSGLTSQCVACHAAFRLQ